MTKVEFVEKVLRLGYAIKQYQASLDESSLIITEDYGENENEEVASVSNTNVGEFSLEHEASFELGIYVIQYSQTPLEER